MKVNIFPTSKFLLILHLTFGFFLFTRPKSTRAGGKVQYPSVLFSVEIYITFSYCPFLLIFKVNIHVRLQRRDEANQVLSPCR
jgi:hypothetical protein